MLFGQTMFFKSPVLPGTPKEKLQAELREIGWWQFVDKGLMARYCEIEIVVRCATQSVNGQQTQGKPPGKSRQQVEGKMYSGRRPKIRQRGGMQGTAGSRRRGRKPADGRQRGMTNTAKGDWRRTSHGAPGPLTTTRAGT